LLHHQEFLAPVFWAELCDARRVLRQRNAREKAGRLEPQIWGSVRRRNLRLVDCISFAIMRQRSIRKVFAFERDST